MGGAGTVVEAARRLPPLLGSRRWRGWVSPAASPQGSRRWIDLPHRCQRSGDLQTVASSCSLKWKEVGLGKTLSARQKGVLV
ncbi:hypothetical protein NDU88_001283 [Pleurodeles waltl]|uniref:Uncharacterized protein n=1 Tax=Pleurodeles waltl TaxID=8319 RepID=A0AAV7SBW5_PLEWA|nr:hypothetical protein NDU88_001283 [Pleurodeles waltl]